MPVGAFKQTLMGGGVMPEITASEGDIVTGYSTNLTLSVTPTYSPTNAVDVVYYDGATLVATTANQTVTPEGSVTTTVPSAVYGKPVGTNITIKVKNYPGGKESLSSALVCFRSL